MQDRIDRITDIIMYLLKKMKRNTNLKDLDLNVLSKHGYSPNEISNALTWIDENYSELKTKKSNLNKSEINSFRILHNIERNIITASAFGYLIKVKESGIINNLQAEEIIDRLMRSDLMPVKLEDLKKFVGNFILENNSFKNKFTDFSQNSSNTIH